MTPTITLSIVASPRALADWLSAVRGPLYLDTETTGLEPFMGDRMIGLALHDVGRESSIYVPLRHEWRESQGSLFDAPDSFQNAPPDETLAVLREKLSSLPVRVWHPRSGKFDMHILARDGIRCASVTDIALHARITTSGERGGADGYSLKPFAASLSLPTEPADRLAAWLKAHRMGMGDLASADPRLVSEYAMADVELTAAVDRRLNREGLARTLALEDAVLPEIYEMERVGTPVNISRIGAEIRRLEGEKEEIARQFPGIKMGDSEVVGRFLASRGVKLTVKTATEEWATDEDTLTDLHHPLADAVLEWRWRGKAVAFLSDIREHVSRTEDGRIHAKFSQLVRTGRATCSEPNLHQMPADKDYGVRQLFVAPPGYRLWIIDFDQLQLRLLAVLCNERKMIAAFRRGADIHSLTQTEMGLPNRKTAKIGNFAKAFGGGRKVLAQQLGCSEEEATGFIHRWDMRFPAVKDGYHRMRKDAEKDPVVRIASGRKRRIEQGREQIALNTAIQMEEADHTKTALTVLGPAVRDLGGQVTNFVHDEFHVLLPEAVSEEKVQDLADLCESMSGEVPITVSLALADPSWAEKRTFERKRNMSSEAKAPAETPPVAVGRDDPSPPKEGEGEFDYWTLARIKHEHACAIARMQDGSKLAIICCPEHRAKAPPGAVVYTAEYVTGRWAEQRIKGTVQETYD